MGTCTEAPTPGQELASAAEGRWDGSSQTTQMCYACISSTRRQGKRFPQTRKRWGGIPETLPGPSAGTEEPDTTVAGNETSSALRETPAGLKPAPTTRSGSASWGGFSRKRTSQLTVGSASLATRRQDEDLGISLGQTENPGNSGEVQLERQSDESTVLKPLTLGLWGPAKSKGHFAGLAPRSPFPS